MMNTYPDTDYISRSVEQWLIKKPRGLNMTIKCVAPLSYEIGMTKSSEDGNKSKTIQWMLFAERLYQADDPVDYILDNLETMYTKLMKEEKEMGKITCGVKLDNDQMLKMAKAAVVAWYNEHNTPSTIGMEDVYIVWFCKALQNWKALAGTHHGDGMYYEITFNGDKDCAYVDAYKKWQNVKMEGSKLREGARC